MKFVIVVTIAVSIFLMIGIYSCSEDENSQQTPKGIIGKDGAKMLPIPAGEFLMGTDPAEIPELVQLAKDQGSSDAKASWFEDETPRHTVSVDAFYMDAYEVTNAQYRKFVQAIGYKEPGGTFKPWNDKNYNGDNQPVVCVTWEDAKAYAEWAGKRLPTEAEWEYSARGGLVGKRYVWGDDWPPPKKSGNFADETLKKVFPSWAFTINGYDDGYAYTAPVGSYKPNGYGLYDMAGNVWEWCADWYGNKYYANSPKSNPKGPDSGKYCVMRGASWYGGDLGYSSGYLCVASRGSYDPTDTNNLVGFRCVVSATP